MSLTANAKKTMLNAVVADTLKLHTGFPGTTGANEVTGGAPAYAAKACSYGLSSAGEPRQLSATVTFDVPACSVEWASGWAAGQCVFIAPTAGDPIEFSTDLTANTVRAPGHGYANNDNVVFFLETAPAPLVVGTKYFVVGATTDDFQVSSTLGGSAINLTAHADRGCLVSKIVPRVYAAQDTHTVATFPFGLPN